MIEQNWVKLLLGVARLGDADLFGLWSSRGLTAAGEYVLGNVFARTWTWTALECAVLSATQRHAEVLTRETAIHLFSDQLPVKNWALNWLREQKLRHQEDGLLTQMRSWNRDAARETIRQWAAVESPSGEILAQGRRLGSVSKEDLMVAERVDPLIRKLVAAYVDQPKQFHFPYFDLR